jgi:hypothetical protein
MRFDLAPTRFRGSMPRVRQAPPFDLILIKIKEIKESKTAAGSIFPRNIALAAIYGARFPTASGGTGRTDRIRPTGGVSENAPVFPTAAAGGRKGFLALAIAPSRTTQDPYRNP